ncbi:MAG: formyltetrahydrofolate deformylase [Deltaproteobacteria bacterium]|nr:formyltetrahydrofolate deformylase [Deltaproteobacteria bacterium]MBN2671866.1 formyltetrahydrofolate deformylase [Deltaproteobacteria bacterium]
MGKRTDRYILLIDCPDAKGLVAKVSTALFEREVNILSNREFVDPESGHFFMRTEFSGTTNHDELLDALRHMLPDSGNIRLAEKCKKRLVVLATKEPHCLGDLLIRSAYNDLNASIEAVIGNRVTLGPLVEKFKIPFHLVSSENKDRLDHAMEMMNIIKTYNPDFLVLAKYMRVLPPEFVAQFRNRIVNIHHSFLPAFIGANPYKQAYERGVKIIGATAHFVTDNLDEGPIIDQDVVPVNHRFTSVTMSKAGKDVEKTVLAKALDLVVNDRVFVSGNKTVVFD